MSGIARRDKGSEIAARPALRKATTFTSNTETTLTLHADTRSVIVEAVGGGGGGGGARANGTATTVSVAGGGSGGSYIRAYANASDIVGRKLFITVGKGGAGGSHNGTAFTTGADGEDSIIKVGADADATSGSTTVLTANKGLGAFAGGAATGTTTVEFTQVGSGGGSTQVVPTCSAPFTSIFAQIGEIGRDGWALSSNSFMLAVPGDGGASLLGNGGRAGPSSNKTSRPGETVNRFAQRGGGGAGAVAVGTETTTQDGGKGADGIVIVYEYA